MMERRKSLEIDLEDEATAGLVCFLVSVFEGVGMLRFFISCSAWHICISLVFLYLVCCKTNIQVNRNLEWKTYE